MKYLLLLLLTTQAFSVNVPERDLNGKTVITVSPFADNSHVEFRGQGIANSIPFGTIKNIDLKTPFDVYFNGLQIIIQNHVLGDNVDLQIVDVDGVVGPAGTVLETFANSWFMATDKQDQGTFLLNYKAKILKDLYFRVKYHSTGGTNVNIYMNFWLHKILP